MIKIEDKELAIKEENKEIAFMEQPKAVAKFGHECASVLKDIVTQASLIQKIQGNDYMKFEGWQTVAKFYNTQAGIEWTKPVEENGKIEGFEARAYVKNEKGEIISTAESYCGRDEKTWKDKPIFAIRSMAQSRASAKALRQVYAWVVVLAGYKPTPAEEMGDITPNSNYNKVSKDIPTYVKGMVCIACGDDVSQKVYEYSMDKRGLSLCYNCQQLPEEDLRNLGTEKTDQPDVTVKEEIIDITKEGK